MQQAVHPHIVQLIEVYETPDVSVVVMYSAKHRRPLTEVSLPSPLLAIFPALSTGDGILSAW